MTRRAVLLFVLIVAGCTNAPPPSLGPSPGPDSPAAPSANASYRPVLAGTAEHGVGGKP
jgi:hypothetical protein